MQLPSLETFFSPVNLAIHLFNYQLRQVSPSTGMLVPTAKLTIHWLPTKCGKEYCSSITVGLVDVIATFSIGFSFTKGHSKLNFSMKIEKKETNLHHSIPYIIHICVNFSPRNFYPSLFACLFCLPPKLTTHRCPILYVCTYNHIAYILLLNIDPKYIVCY